MGESVVIVAATRTAIGSFNGSLAGISATDLGAIVIRDLLKKTNLAPEAIDEVILGQVLTAGMGQNPARQTMIKAGLPQTTPALTINKVCGSGLKAVHLAAQVDESVHARLLKDSPQWAKVAKKVLDESEEPNPFDDDEGTNEEE